MNILIDFGAIKTGGGVQLATNFLNRLRSQRSGQFEKIFLLVADSGPLSEINLNELCDAYEYYPNNYLKRKWFEITKLRDFLRKNNINIIYTFFGAGLPRFKGVKSIVSVAYPIICYPDSNYWRHIDFIPGVKKRLVNTLRRARIRSADKVVVETSVMANRIAKYAGVEKQKIRVIPPSPTQFLQDKPYVVHEVSVNKILLLSGTDPHKNIWRLPQIADELISKGVNNFKFIISVDKENFLRSLGGKSDIDSGVIDAHFEFKGAIPASKIEQIYDECHYLLNISDLESFSNNYMEAWKAGLPLICSDTDFARNICRSSAIYVNPHDPYSSADSIALLFMDKKRQADMVSEGKKLLKNLPDPDQKFNLIQQVILED